MATPRIHPLPDAVVAQIKSSATITSLPSVVIDLLRNSIDAGALKVDISVDMQRGGCTVEDDGRGIPAVEFHEGGGLGRMYYTSKHPASCKVHGRNGTFLASLAALSLITITSRHTLQRSYNTVMLHHSRPISRQVPALPHQYSAVSDHGTRVVVRDLFGNLPVRVKQRGRLAQLESEIDKEWEALRRGVVSLLLAWSSDVSVAIKDVEGKRRLAFRKPAQALRSVPERNSCGIAKIQKILCQSSYVTSESRGHWVPLSASSSALSLEGAISLEPAPTKKIQFLSLGIRPILADTGNNVLYDHVNRLFAMSRFGGVVQEDAVDDRPIDHRVRDGISRGDEYANKQLRGGKKGVDRWPMYALRIELHGHGRDLTSADDQSVFDFPSGLESVLGLLTATIRRFLEEHHLLLHRQNSNGAEKTRRTLVDQTGTVLTEKDGPHNRASTAVPSPPASTTTNSSCCRDSSSRRARHSGGTVEPLGGGVKMPFFAGQPLNRLRVFNRGAIGSLDEDATRPQAEGLVENTNPATDVTCSVDGWTGTVVPRPSAGPPSTPSSRQETPRGRPRTKDHVPLSRSETHWTTDKAPKDWLGGNLEAWANPTFQPTEQSIPAVSNGGHVLEETSSWSRLTSSCSINLDKGAPVVATNLSKQGMLEADVIAQVDGKFILFKTQISGNRADHAGPREMLVMIDQHAADERCRIERLLTELCTLNEMKGRKSPLSLESRVLTTPLVEPISFLASSQEVRLLEKLASHFADWGVLYGLSPAAGPSGPLREDMHNVSIISLPPGIAARCKAEPRLLMDMLRSEIWREGMAQERRSLPSEPPIEDAGDKPTWPNRIKDCPRGIIDMLNSRSCRSAIMFNDVLSLDDCRNLLLNLTECAFPFQCAHGRPTMIPLVELDAGSEAPGLGMNTTCGTSTRRPVQDIGFAEAFWAWEAAEADWCTDEA